MRRSLSLMLVLTFIPLCASSAPRVRTKTKKNVAVRPGEVRLGATGWKVEAPRGYELQPKMTDNRPGRIRGHLTWWKDLGDTLSDGGHTAWLGAKYGLLKHRPEGRLSTDCSAEEQRQKPRKVKHSKGLYARVYSCETLQEYQVDVPPYRIILISVGTPEVLREAHLSFEELKRSLKRIGRDPPARQEPVPDPKPKKERKAVPLLR